MRRARFAALAAAGMLVAACNSDRLNVPNYNNPTPKSVASDPAALQLLVSGILYQDRDQYAGFISDVGIFGRESYDYFPTDARTVTHYLVQNPLDPAGFTSGGWTLRYRNLRNIFNFIQAVTNINPGLVSPAQKQAAFGFAHTFEALTLYYIAVQRWNLGAVVQINADPRQPAPFVSRDSVWNYIAAEIDKGATELTAAGSASFPFSLHAGFSGFDSPASFLAFNRALAARFDVIRASLARYDKPNAACGTGGITCYQRALAELKQSFMVLDPGQLSLGVYHLYSGAAGDILNQLNAQISKDLLAHPSILTDYPNGDARITAKIRFLGITQDPNNPNKLDTLTRGPSGGSENGIPTPIGFQIYPSPTSPTPIIRNEELILIDAEAQWFAGSKATAIADINFIRQYSGVVGPTNITTSSTDDQFITALLNERRLSLLWEGFRWTDVRRFNRLSTLPLDLPIHHLQMQQPIPLAECQYREKLPSNLQCPPQG